MLIDSLFNIAIKDTSSHLIAEFNSNYDSAHIS
jgi:hypothetical protein